MIEGGEEKLGEGETKIAMDQYYMDEYDQYAEGILFFLCLPLNTSNTYWNPFKNIFLCHPNCTRGNRASAFYLFSRPLRWRII